MMQPTMHHQESAKEEQQQLQPQHQHQQQQQQQHHHLHHQPQLVQQQQLEQQPEQQQREHQPPKHLQEYVPTPCTNSDVEVQAEEHTSTYQRQQDQYQPISPSSVNLQVQEETNEQLSNHFTPSSEAANTLQQHSPLSVLPQPLVPSLVHASPVLQRSKDYQQKQQVEQFPSHTSDDLHTPQPHNLEQEQQQQQSPKQQLYQQKAHRHPEHQQNIAVVSSSNSQQNQNLKSPHEVSPLQQHNETLSGEGPARASSVEPYKQPLTETMMQDSSSDSDRATKKSAQLGQWRTPPQPFFPSATTTTSSAGVHGTAVDANTTINPALPFIPSDQQNVTTGSATATRTTVPPSASAAANSAAAAAAASDQMMDDLKDFDLASLQEAYRRGMAAAAALSQHQMTTGQNVFHGLPSNVPPTPNQGGTTPQQATVSATTTEVASTAAVGNSASCPNFQEMNNGPQQVQQGVVVQPYTPTGEEPDPQLITQQHQAQFQQPFQPPHHHQQQPIMQQAQPNQACVYQMQGQFGPHGSVVQPQSQQVHPQPIAAIAPGTAAPQQHQAAAVQDDASSSVGARSVSLPDIQSYAIKASQEEDKRKKRLARNRASARLRRLRKKNLVESYEGEVGVLETSLAKLRAHRWGGESSGNQAASDHDALLEALSMDRGQQNLPLEARRELIKTILGQQREQVSNLMDAQMENMVLGWFVRREGSGEDGKMKVEAQEVTVSQKSKKEPDLDDEQERKKMEEEDALAKELKDLLQLTPEQTVQLHKATEGVEEERKAIMTVDMCLEAMMNNSWLTNQAVEECIEQFSSILNSGQLSKFLLWADHNSEAIDQLDYVNAPPASAPPAQSPMFVFGTDDCLQQDDGDGSSTHGISAAS